MFIMEAVLIQSTYHWLNSSFMHAEKVSNPLLFKLEIDD